MNRVAEAQPKEKNPLFIRVVLFLVFTAGEKNRDHTAEGNDYSEYRYDNFHNLLQNLIYTPIIQLS